MSEKPMFWLWPDRVIGKRESRRLRDEHNAAMNERAEMYAALKVVALTPGIRTHLEQYDPKALRQIEKAIAKAEGVA